MKSQSRAICAALALLATACEDTAPSNLEDDRQAEESAQAASGQGEILDVSLAACAKTHPLAGRDLTLTTRAHATSGTVRIVDDCTLVISNFAYDGKGRQVELYGSIRGSFPNGVALSGDLLRPSKPYSGAQLIVRLPASIKLGDLDGLSVWCSDVNVSFADVALR